MNFLKIYFNWWDKKELSGWTSLRKTGYILLPLLLYFAVHDVAEIILWWLVNQMLLHGSKQVLEFAAAYAYTIKGMVNGLAILAGVACIYKMVAAEISGNTGLFNKEASALRKQGAGFSANLIIGYLVLCVLAFSSAVSFNLLFSLTGFTGSSVNYAYTAASQYGVEFLIGLVLYGIISPFAEEAVFRGLIYNRMKRCYPRWIPIVFSSLLFGCYHLNLVQGVYGFLLGLLIAGTYEYYQSFAAPVLFHAIANVSIYAITYHNSMAKMDRMTAIVTCVISFTAAVVSFIFICIKIPAGLKRSREEG